MAKKKLFLKCCSGNMQIWQEGHPKAAVRFFRNSFLIFKLVDKSRWWYVISNCNVTNRDLSRVWGQIGFHIVICVFGHNGRPAMWTRPLVKTLVLACNVSVFYGKEVKSIRSSCEWDFEQSLCANGKPNQESDTIAVIYTPCPSFLCYTFMISCD